jgi:hypothetical protein
LRDGFDHALITVLERIRHGGDTFLSVRRAAVTTLFLLGLAASPAAARQHKQLKPPTKSEIRAAVNRAKRSRNLWATVNICDTVDHPNIIGIRGQLPALGFKTKMSMLVQVDYWVFADGRFEPDTSVPRQRVSLGKKAHATGLWQGGITIPFTPPVVLSGTVTFRWKLGKKVIGSVTRQTGHGYKGVTHSDPPHYSTATCAINAP